MHVTLSPRPAILLAGEGKFFISTRFNINIAINVGCAGLSWVSIACKILVQDEDHLERGEPEWPGRKAVID